MSNLKNSFRIYLLKQDIIFFASSSVALVESALAAGINLPSSCRNGTCRACLCTLLSGEVAYQIEWPGLSFDEKLEGAILPCVAFATSDLTIEVDNAVLTSVNVNNDR